MFVDGVESGPQFDGVIHRTFSPTGSTSPTSTPGSKWIGVLDGKEGPPFDILSGLAFSSDSRRFDAGADVHKSVGSQKAQSHAVVDGEAGPQFEGNQVGSFTKSMLTGTYVAIVEGYFNQLFSTRTA